MWSLFVEVFFRKNTSTKRPQGCEVFFAHRKVHFSLGKSVLRKVYLGEYTLQKDFTPLGSFCWPYFSWRTLRQKDPRGVKSFCRGKVRSTKRPQGCEVFFAYKKVHFSLGKSVLEKVYLGEYTLQKDFTPLGSFCWPYFSWRTLRQKDPRGVKSFCRGKVRSTKRPHGCEVFLLKCSSERTLRQKDPRGVKSFSRTEKYTFP